MKILLKDVPDWLAQWTAFVWFLFSLFFLTLVLVGVKVRFPHGWMRIRV